MGFRSTLGWVLIIGGCSGAPANGHIDDGESTGSGGNDASGWNASSEAGEAGCGGPAAPGNVDGRCMCDNDCPSGGICATEDATGYPGGECIQLCDPQQAGACGTNATCLAPPAGSASGASCVRKCSASADCPAGRICDTQDAMCILQCVADSDCLSGHCNAYTGLCDDGAVPAGLGLQARCTTNSDCKSNYCNPEGLRCTSICEVGVSQCPESGVCLAISAGSNLGDCAPPCNADGTCADATLQCGKITSGPSGCIFPMSDCLGSAAKDVYGADCNCAADCPTGATCQTEMASGNPHGICIANCQPGITDCGPSAHCLTTQSGSYCAATCMVDTDCPGVADVCDTDNICLSICQSNSDCLSGACDLYTGRCGIASTTGAGVGAVCQADGDCISGECVVLDGGSGFCSSLCSVSRQGCPDHAVCIDTEGDAGNEGICVKACATDADCLLPTLKCVLTSSTSGYCYPR
jgi:hypothetical protein